MTNVSYATSDSIRATLEEALAEAVSAAIGLEDALAASLREHDAVLDALAQILGAQDGENVEDAARRAMSWIAHRDGQMAMASRRWSELDAALERVAAERDNALQELARSREHASDRDQLVRRLADLGTTLGARDLESLEDAALRVMKELDDARAKRLEERAELERVAAERDAALEENRRLLSRASYAGNGIDEVRWFSGGRPL